MSTTTDPLDKNLATVPVPDAEESRWRSWKVIPWWLVILVLVGILVVVQMLTDETFGRIFEQLRAGIGVTLFVSFVAYAIATVIGILIGLIRSNPPNERSSVIRVLTYNLATLYLEIFRGLPILVVLLITAFVAVPAFINFLAGLGVPITVRDVDMTWRAIIALSLAYGAFLSEIFRAGIQSIGRGQIEAALSVGMTPYQTMRFIILPQAFRRILPPLGNDLIAMIKDSALVAFLAVRDITQLAKLSSGQSFLYLETYLIAAAIYLSMTLVGSLLVRLLETRFGQIH